MNFFIALVFGAFVVFVGMCFVISVANMVDAKRVVKCRLADTLSSVVLFIILIVLMYVGMRLRG